MSRIRLLLRVLVATETYLLSRCLATVKGGHIQTANWWEGFKKYAVEVGSGAMMYELSFITTGSGIQKGDGGINIQTESKVIP
jgi:hypothetical protein